MSSTPVMCAKWLLAAAWLALGCGRITGIDGYTVGEPRVDNPCSVLEVLLSDGRCERVGVRACPSGFIDDQAGGCTAILPDTACDSGQTAVPGNATCRPVDSCYDRFPLLPNPWTGAVRYVHADAADGGDGSELRPLATIAAALASANGPVAILIARGDYRGNFSFDRPVRLQGVCAERTSLSGMSAEIPVITIGPGASGTQIGGGELWRPNDRRGFGARMQWRRHRCGERSRAKPRRYRRRIESVRM